MAQTDRWTGRSTTMLLRGITFALMSSAAVAADAQPMLDTTGVFLSTAKLATLGPLQSDKWFFTRVAEIAVDSRGQVFVLDDLDCRIHVFDAAGARVRTLGRKGAGPGEFDRPRRLQILGDTVLLGDRGNHRIVAFSAVTGKVLTTRRAYPGQSPLGFSPSGQYESTGGFDVKPGQKIIPFGVAHLDNTSRKSTTLASLTGRNGQLSYTVYRDKLPLVATTRGGIAHTSQPFDDRALLDVTPDGRLLIVVERSATDVTTSRNPFARASPQALIRIRSTAPGGEIVAERTYKTVARTLSANDVGRVIDSLSRFKILPTYTSVARPSDIRDSLFIPPIWPPVIGLIVGKDGTLWLRQPQAPSPIARFWRIDAAGNQLPSVAVPSRLRILQVTADRIWAAAEDAEENPIVEVHRVVRN